MVDPQAARGGCHSSPKQQGTGEKSTPYNPPSRLTSPSPFRSVQILMIDTTTAAAAAVDISNARCNRLATFRAELHH